MSLFPLCSLCCPRIWLQDPTWKCFYFTTISFSTVGYGDFLVKADPASRGLNTMGFVVTLYLGVSFFSLFLATLQVGAVRDSDLTPPFPNLDPRSSLGSI